MIHLLEDQAQHFVQQINCSANKLRVFTLLKTKKYTGFKSAVFLREQKAFESKISVTLRKASYILFGILCAPSKLIQNFVSDHLFENVAKVIAW